MKLAIVTAFLALGAARAEAHEGAGLHHHLHDGNWLWLFFGLAGVAAAAFVWRHK